MKNSQQTVPIDAPHRWMQPTQLGNSAWILTHRADNEIAWGDDRWQRKLHADNWKGTKLKLFNTEEECHHYIAALARGAEQGERLDERIPARHSTRKKRAAKPHAQTKPPLAKTETSTARDL